MAQALPIVTTVPHGRFVLHTVWDKFIRQSHSGIYGKKQKLRYSAFHKTTCFAP